MPQPAIPHRSHLLNQEASHMVAIAMASWQRTFWIESSECVRNGCEARADIPCTCFNGERTRSETILSRLFSIVLCVIASAIGGGAAGSYRIHISEHYRNPFRFGRGRSRGWRLHLLPLSTCGAFVAESG